jgi:hypothetical protein
MKNEEWTTNNTKKLRNSVYVFCFLSAGQHRCEEKGNNTPFKTADLAVLIPKNVLIHVSESASLIRLKK